MSAGPATAYKLHRSGGSHVKWPHTCSGQWCFVSAVYRRLVAISSTRTRAVTTPHHTGSRIEVIAFGLNSRSSCWSARRYNMIETSYSKRPYISVSLHASRAMVLFANAEKLWGRWTTAKAKRTATVWQWVMKWQCEPYSRSAARLGHHSQVDH